MMKSSSTPPPPMSVMASEDTAADISSSPSEFHLMVDMSQDDTVSKPAASFWSSSISAITRVAENVEGRLAGWFGMNNSKFQWAMDAYLQERAIAAERKKLQSQTSGNGRMSAGREQVMQRGGLPV